LRNTVPLYLGIHLSGPNASKTAAVVVSGDPLLSPLALKKVYEKIGGFGTSFSDDRLLDIVRVEGPFARIFVDTPLSVPPCVACVRPSCPGVSRCDDVAVAYMVSMNDRAKGKSAAKFRPVNPQSQRLWDVLQAAGGARGEPTYSANLAPLVTRGLTLQRRLNSLTPVVRLQESSVPLLLKAVSEPLGLGNAAAAYRNFEKGERSRRQILEGMARAGWLVKNEDLFEDVIASVETFQAFLVACVGAWQAAGLTTPKPSTFLHSEGWVELPELHCEI
jgi:hypothetical protein